MVNKSTKGYTKSKLDILKIFEEMKSSSYSKIKDESVNSFVTRKTEEQVYGESKQNKIYGNRNKNKTRNF